MKNYVSLAIDRSKGLGIRLYSGTLYQGIGVIWCRNKLIGTYEALQHGWHHVRLDARQEGNRHFNDQKITADTLGGAMRFIKENS